MLTLREVDRVVAHHFAAELGDREIGRETPGNGTDLLCFREQPRKRQRAGQYELREPPVRVDLDRPAQACEAVNHASEIDVGNPDEEMPVEQQWIAGAEPHRLRNMGPSLACPSEEELH